MGNPSQMDWAGLTLVCKSIQVGATTPGTTGTDIQTSQTDTGNVTAGSVTTSGTGNITTGGYFIGSNSATVPGHSGGGQGSAVALTNEVNTVSGAAATSPFDSVSLPLAAVGLEIIVVNSSSNPVQVFGAGTDTINGVATATGVTQPANSVVLYVCNTVAPGGKWFSEGLGTGYSGSLQTVSALGGLTAVGANRAAALAIVNSLNRLTTVAAGTGVVLPASAVGLELTVSNQGANPVVVYATGSDTVDGAAGATGIIQVAGSVATYFCTTTGAWESDKSNTGVSARVFHTGSRAPATNADFTNTTPVATTSYVAEVLVPANATLTGVAIVNGTAVSGNVTVFLADHNGNNLAHSASTAQSGTSVYQRVPFTAAYAARGPGTYYIVLQIDNTTGRIATHPFGNFGATSFASGTYGTFPAGLVATPPTTFTTNVGPVASLY